MAISTAVQKGKIIHVYNEKGHQIFVQTVGSGVSDGLKGYTSNSVTIQKGNIVHVYNEKGCQVTTYAV